MYLVGLWSNPMREILGAPLGLSLAVSSCVSLLGFGQLAVGYVVQRLHGEPPEPPVHGAQQLLIERAAKREPGPDDDALGLVRVHR